MIWLWITIGLLGLYVWFIISYISRNKNDD